MTLKTTVMMLKIQLCFTGINYNLKYIKTENFKKLVCVSVFICTHKKIFDSKHLT